MASINPTPVELDEMQVSPCPPTPKSLPDENENVLQTENGPVQDFEVPSMPSQSRSKLRIFAIMGALFVRLFSYQPLLIIYVMYKHVYPRAVRRLTLPSLELQFQAPITHFT